MVKVIPITPRGFCPGVVRAIAIVEKVLEDPSYPRPIQILGMIVHNRNVVEELRAKGAVSIMDLGKPRLDLLDDIDKGTVIITAHGADPRVFRKARKKGLIVVDATCNDVYRTHDEVKKRIAAGYEVIFVGKKNHPETEAIQCLSERITIVENSLDVQKLASTTKPLFATNQTTFSHLDLEGVYSTLIEKFPGIVIHDEICNSTRIRQEAIIDYNTRYQVDLCYIVGDPHSNNTRNLVAISEQATKTRTILIESIADIDPLDLKDVSIVSVSSGASTPTKLTNTVIAYLESL